MDKQLVGIYDNLSDAYESILRLVGLGYKKEDIFLLRHQGSVHCVSQTPPQTKSAVAREQRATAQRQMMREASTVCEDTDACAAFFTTEEEQRQISALEKDLACGRIVIFMTAPNQTGQSPPTAQYTP